MIAPLIVDYSITHDMDDGQPLPPFIDDDHAAWRVVGRLPASPTTAARTHWRRVRLSEQQTSEQKISEEQTTERAIARRMTARTFTTSAVTTKKRNES